MVFSQRWFEELGLANFERLKNNININKPINYLEIGCFEGNSHIFMYKNILIHPESKSTVIDPFGGGTGSSQHHDVYDIFIENLKDYLNKITMCRGLSNNEIPKLKEKFDIIYIDGDHSAKQTYLDSILSWNLLKKDGIMIFDDYMWGTFRQFYPDEQEGLAIGEFNHPAAGINKFLEEKKGQYELFGKEHGFEKECKIIDLKKKHDIEYVSKLTNINYQIWIKKISDENYDDLL